MSSESSEDRRIQELWQGQPKEGIVMSAGEVRERAGKFERRIRRRNAREYVAALAVVVFFGIQFWRTDDVPARLGFALVIAGTLYVMWHLHSRGAARTLPQDVGLASSIEFERRELERQRDLLSGVWRWYLGPLIPGLAVLVAAFGRAAYGHVSHPGLLIGSYAAAMAAMFVFIGKLNSRAARRLQMRIDELNELERQA